MDEIKGKVIIKNDIESYDKGFSKQTLVIETDGQYPQKLPVEFLKENTSKITDIKVGDNVTIGINIRSNEYNNRFYVSLIGWRVVKNNNTRETPF